MYSWSILKRNGTNKLYRVTSHMHWSDIVNVDDPADIDYVKCVDGDSYYVSANLGHGYTVLKDCSWDKENNTLKFP